MATVVMAMEVEREEVEMVAAVRAVVIMEAAETEVVVTEEAVRALVAEDAVTGLGMVSHCQLLR